MYLEHELARHDIDASVFVPFVVARLQSTPEANGAELAVRIAAEGAAEETSVLVRIEWDAKSHSSRGSAIQDRVVTEWAALGVACALLPELLGVVIVSVAMAGDSFDYRVSDGVHEWGLEVGGTMAEAEGVLRDRLRLKVRQLHDNPYGIMGYVVVTGFVLQRAMVSVPNGSKQEH